MTSPLRRRASAGTLVAMLAVIVVVLSSCGVVNAVKKVARAAHDVTANKAAIDTFTSRLPGAGATFEATYTTTGSAPATVVYAVEPPNGVAFKETPSAGGSSEDIIVNSQGEYSCTTPTSGAPSCQKLGTADAATENQIFDFYTPSHWVNFLKDFSLAAGFAGDKVTSSTMTVNGFDMQCVDFVASGVAGTSTICTTSAGILGYVMVASDSTSFEIQSYSATPPASLFQLPAGATVVTVPTTGTTP